MAVQKRRGCRYGQATSSKRLATGVPAGAVGPVAVAAGWVVLVDAGVKVEVEVMVGELVGVCVGEAVGVRVAVGARVAVAVGIGVAVGRRVEVAVGVRVSRWRPKRVPSCWAEYSKKPTAAKSGSTSKKSINRRMLRRPQPAGAQSPCSH